MLIGMEMQQLMKVTKMLGGRKNRKHWEPHSFIGKGKVFFRKTEKGWEGYDGVVYNE